VLLGEAGVGKSSLVLRFVANHFKAYSESTIGAAFMSKTLVVDDQAIKFQVRKLLLGLGLGLGLGLLLPAGGRRCLAAALPLPGPPLLPARPAAAACSCCRRPL